MSREIHDQLRLYFKYLKVNSDAAKQILNQLTELGVTLNKVPGCSACKEEGMRPSHCGSTLCESGSIASGGHSAHCTCDVCF